MWGDFSALPGGDSGYRVVEPGSRIDLWSIACDLPPDPDASDPDASGPDGATDVPYQCFPARLRLPDSAPSSRGDYASAKEEFARVHRCFDVRLRKAPSSVVAAAVTGDMEPATHIVAQQPTPTLLVVAWLSHVGFTRQFDVFLNTSADNNINEWRPLAIPPQHPIDQVTIGIVKAPGARDIVDAIRAGKYRTALTRAKAVFALEKRFDDDTKSAMRANVASAAILAGSKRDVVAEDGFNDLALDSGNGAVVELARRWARGEVWLGPDPCNGPLRASSNRSVRSSRG